MMGLRRSRDYWKKSWRVKIYNALKSVYAGEELPANFSWTDKPNIVTPAKYQGYCGSCYAFAAVGAIESMLAIWNQRPNLDLSEQEMVDCSDNLGCGGGYMEYVFGRVANTGGIIAEKEYPYKEAHGQCLQPDVPKYATAITYTQLPRGDEDGLRRVLYHLGPVGIGLHANSSSFFDYHDGIYDAVECNEPDAAVDHTVLLVGWGEENGDLYWRIKNSWGEEWGQKGFGKILRGVGQCKIGQMASVPIVKSIANKLLAKNPISYDV